MPIIDWVVDIDIFMSKGHFTGLKLWWVGGARYAGNHRDWSDFQTSSFWSILMFHM